jgi:hypothetical protein
MHINVLKPKTCELIQKVTKYAKLCNNNFYIWNVHTTNRIYVESEFQYALPGWICKCLKFRALVMRLAAVGWRSVSSTAVTAARRCDGRVRTTYFTRTIDAVYRGTTLTRYRRRHNSSPSTTVRKNRRCVHGCVMIYGGASTWLGARNCGDRHRGGPPVLAGRRFRDSCGIPWTFRLPVFKRERSRMISNAARAGFRYGWRVRRHTGARIRRARERRQNKN